MAALTLCQRDMLFDNVKETVIHRLLDDLEKVLAVCSVSHIFPPSMEPSSALRSQYAYPQISTMDRDTAVSTTVPACCCQIHLVFTSAVHLHSL